MYGLFTLAVTEACAHLVLEVPVWDSRTVDEPGGYLATIQFSMAVN